MPVSYLKRFSGDARYDAEASFSFTKFADNQSDFSSISASPVINDSGTVAFVATPSGGTQGIYTNSGGTITKITDTNAVSSLFYNLPPAFYFFSQTVDINNNGTVAFLANVKSQILFSFTQLLLTDKSSSSIMIKSFGKLSIKACGVHEVHTKAPFN
ncbi:MAG: hypothetical protein PUP91_29305 [Rhizonema sp. PD37]|nr:hypothetical protein [Rhizonema sp. PD37]